jgi:hypothetical protein
MAGTEPAMCFGGTLAGTPVGTHDNEAEAETFDSAQTR